MLRKHCFPECFLGAQSSGKNAPLPGNITLKTNFWACSIWEMQCVRPRKLVNTVSSPHKRGNISSGNRTFSKKKTETYFVSGKQTMFSNKCFHNKSLVTLSAIIFVRLSLARVKNFYAVSSNRMQGKKFEEPHRTRLRY